jgi:hypothetical protein
LTPAPRSASGGTEPLLLGRRLILIDVQADALGDLLERLILLYQRLELTQALGHPLFRAAELFKNWPACFHVGCRRFTTPGQNLNNLGAKTYIEALATDGGRGWKFGG